MEKPKIIVSEKEYADIIKYRAPYPCVMCHGCANCSNYKAWKRGIDDMLSPEIGILSASYNRNYLEKMNNANMMMLEAQRLIESAEDFKRTFDENIVVDSSSTFDLACEVDLTEREEFVRMLNEEIERNF